MRFPFPWLHAVILATRWRWIPGSIALFIVAICLRVGAFQSSEYLSFNTLTRLRGEQSWHDDIVVIEIDDTTLKAVGGFPLSRRYYAQVLDFLMHAESGVVVLGVVFSEPSPDDARLAQAMLYHGQVVLAQAWNQQGFPILPPPTLRDNAIHSGHVLNYPDNDGITRSIQPYIQGVPALGVAAIQAYSLTTDLVSTPVSNQSFWVNWPGSNDGLEKYSFLDVLQRNVESDRFHNKLVIIGSSVAGVDPIATPFNQDPPATGIDLQAAVISNLLYGNSLQVFFPPYRNLLLWFGGPFLSLWLSHYGILRRWLVGHALVISWLGLGLILLKLNVWIPVVWPITLLVLGVSFTEISTRLKANTTLQQEVERLWQTYHRDVLIQSERTDHSPMPLATEFWNMEFQDATNVEPNVPTINNVNAAMVWGDASGAGQNLEETPQWPWLEPISVRRTQQLTTLVEVFGRSQALHGAIARSLSIGLVAADWAGQVWFCNPAATDFLGIGMGHSLPETLIPQWLNEQTWEQYLYSLRQGQAIRWEHYHGEQWFEMSLEPLFQVSNVPSPLQKKQSPHPTNALYNLSSLHSDRLARHTEQAREELMGVLLLVEDITTYKQVEVEVRKALAQEKEFNELKSRFVSMVSHELRTPLTIIRTSLEMLERRRRKEANGSLNGYSQTMSQPSSQANTVAFNNTQQKYFQRIDNAVSSMTQLLEDVLLLGKVESKKLEFKPQYIDCVQLCHSIVEEMQIQPLGVPRILFTTQGDRIARYVDVDLLKMILRNLLSNAIKYSPDHSNIHVDLDCRSDAMVIRVEDEGIGIPPDTQQQLFKEFHRATNVGNVPGTGLGLSIVKQCVDLHQGDIVVKSAVDVGSTFIVKLPHHAPA